MSRPLSDATLDAIAAARSSRSLPDGPVPCEKCGKPMLVEHPHNHAVDPNPLYDPMPNKPQTLEGLAAVIGFEFWQENPDRLHTRAVPSQLEPIDLDGWEDGPTMMVTDSGPLGAPSFSPAFHRYIGATRWWEGEMTTADDELQSYPWKKNLAGVRRWCASKHADWYEHQSRPVCWLLAQMVSLDGYSVGQAGAKLGISPDKTRTLLFHVCDGSHPPKHCQRGALEKWWMWVSDDLNGRTMRRVKKPAA